MRFFTLILLLLAVPSFAYCDKGVTQGSWVREGYYFTAISLVNESNEEVSILSEPKWWYFIDSENRGSGAIEELLNSEIPNDTYVAMKATITKWGVKGYADISGTRWYTTVNSGNSFATSDSSLYDDWILDFSSTPSEAIMEFRSPQKVSGDLSLNRLYLSDSSNIYYDNNSSYDGGIYFQKEYILNYIGFDLPVEVRRIKYTASNGSNTLIGEVDVLVDENGEVIELSYHRGSNVSNSLVNTSGSGDVDSFTHNNGTFTLTASDSDTELYKFYGSYNCSNNQATLQKIEKLDGLGNVVDNHTAGISHNGVLQLDGYTLHDNGSVDCLTLNYTQ